MTYILFAIVVLSLLYFAFKNKLPDTPEGTVAFGKKLFKYGFLMMFAGAAILILFAILLTII